MPHPHSIKIGINSGGLKNTAHFEGSGFFIFGDQREYFNLALVASHSFTDYLY
jgi:hypothetical protein